MALARDVVSVLVIFINVSWLSLVDSRIHQLKIVGDDRAKIDMTTFGFYKGGFLQVNITDFKVFPEAASGFDGVDGFDGRFGFTLNKVTTKGIYTDMQSNTDKCFLQEGPHQKKNDDSQSILFFKIFFSNNSLSLERDGDEFQDLQVSNMTKEMYDSERVKRSRRSPEYLRDSYLMPNHRRKREAGTTMPTKGTSTTTVKAPTTNTTAIIPAVKAASLPMSHVFINSIPISKGKNEAYTIQFSVVIKNESQAGLYKLFYHNCVAGAEGLAVNFTANLVEQNGDNYLSAGHIPLPTVYFVLSIIFIVVGCFWLYILRKSTEGVYKIHYLMLALVYVKAMSLLFHSINYHFISKEGHHEQAFAILYYITYLMRGILLFVAIILIGAGWAFVKHILSDRDKKIFLIIIPLQILANVAQIIIEETEEGESDYTTWKDVFILVDLICCGAILFPIVWSIRHLQEASQTDGKVAINLVKLKLFRHFYIVIVCYIYFTRIIVYLIRICVPFQYEWVDDFFCQAATLTFYVITGYKFRPASDNPYLQVPQESEEETEMEEVVTESGALEGLTKVNVKFSSDREDTAPRETVASKRESSHEYD